MLVPLKGTLAREELLDIAPFPAAQMRRTSQPQSAGLRPVLAQGHLVGQVDVAGIFQARDQVLGLGQLLAGLLFGQESFFGLLAGLHFSLGGKLRFYARLNGFAPFDFRLHASCFFPLGGILRLRSFRLLALGRLLRTILRSPSVLMGSVRLPPQPVHAAAGHPQHGDHQHEEADGGAGGMPSHPQEEPFDRTHRACLDRLAAEETLQVVG